MLIGNPNGHHARARERRDERSPVVLVATGDLVHVRVKTNPAGGPHPGNALLMIPAPS